VNADANADAVWRRRAAVLWRRTLEAVVLLPVEGDEVVTLAGTGTEIWELLAEPRTLEALVTVLADAHAADPAIVATDVEPVLERLVELAAVEAVG
jgi:hypothetical protein